jgi:hypothetical protein
MAVRKRWHLGIFPNMHKNAVAIFEICNMMHIKAMHTQRSIIQSQATPLGDIHEPSPQRRLPN